LLENSAYNFGGFISGKRFISSDYSFVCESKDERVTGLFIFVSLNNKTKSLLGISFLSVYYVNVILASF
jgi:hypothetical protein